MIPLATTTITLRRVTETEPGEDRNEAVVARKVRAVIGSASGSRTVAPGGGKTVHEWRLDCDPIPNIDTERYQYFVVDDLTSDRYELKWAALRGGLGLDHIEGGMTRVEGLAA